QCQRPLWHFDVPRKTWSERSPREVGYDIGFYDYVGDFPELASADRAFDELERTYPLARDHIVSDFSRWTDHREFLLTFMQMMKARSLLFFEQKHQEGLNLQAIKVVEVGSDGKTIKY